MATLLPRTQHRKAQPLQQAFSLRKYGTDTIMVPKTPEYPLKQPSIQLQNISKLGKVNKLNK